MFDIACVYHNNIFDLTTCRAGCEAKNLSCCYDDGEDDDDDSSFDDDYDRRRRRINDSGHYCCNHLVSILG